MISGSGSQSPHHHHPPTRHNPHSTLDQTQKLARLFLLLENQFGDEAITPFALDDLNMKALSLDGEKKLDTSIEPGLDISVPPHTARVWLRDLTVESKSAALRQRVQAVLEKAVETVASFGVE
jgi:cleavage and polyadenylation specificity factor subunit 3